jgi:hypothetical protein
VVRLFDLAASQANDLGLLAEEADPATRAPRQRAAGVLARRPDQRCLAAGARGADVGGRGSRAVAAIDLGLALTGQKPIGRPA